MGTNVPLCLFAFDEGGRGKSVRSALRHTAFGPKNHAYVDPIAFFVEEELRKAGEAKSTTCFCTSQEMVRTGPRFKFLAHYLRKVCTMEPISCRPPYAKKTVDVHFRGGWLWEVNDPPESTGPFEATIRRTMVLKSKSRFVSCNSLADPPNGVFLKDPTLLTFVTSPPAGAAMVRHVLYPFMLKYSREQCVEFLGDNGEKLDSVFGSTVFRDTVAFARRMFNISDDFRFEGSDARYNLEPEGANKNPAIPPWAEPKDTCNTEFLDPGRARSAVREAVRKHVRRGKEIYTSNRMFLNHKGCFVECNRRAVYLPAMFGPPLYVPPPTHLDAIFVEEFDHKDAATLAGDPVRKENVRIITECLAAERESLPNGSTASRKTLQDKVEKIRRQEHDLQSLAASPSGVVENLYSFSPKKPPDTIRSRRYSTRPGAQRLSRDTRACLFSNCLDVDMKCSAISFAVQIVRGGQFEKIAGGPENGGNFEDLPFCAQWVERTEETAKMLRESGASNPKKTVLKAFNGGAASALEPAGKSFVAGVAREGRVFRMVAARLRPRALDFFKHAAPARDFPESTNATYLLFEVEDAALMALVDFFGAPRICSLHYDGLLVKTIDGERPAGDETTLRAAEEHIREITGFAIDLCCKKPPPALCDHIRANTSPTGSCLGSPFGYNGNCIVESISNVAGIMAAENPYNNRWARLEEAARNFAQSNNEPISYARALDLLRKESGLEALDFRGSLGQASLGTTWRTPLLIHCGAHCVGGVTGGGPTLFVIDQRREVRRLNIPPHIFDVAEARGGKVAAAFAIFFRERAQDVTEEALTRQEATLRSLSAGTYDGVVEGQRDWENTKAADTDHDPVRADEGGDRTPKGPSDPRFSSQKSERADKKYLGRLKEEVDRSLRRIRAESHGVRGDPCFTCHLCPARTFPRKDRLIQHVEAWHTSKNTYVCSGAQENVARALHNGDLIDGVLGGSAELPNLLERSAKLLRFWAARCDPSCWDVLKRQTSWDNYVVLLLTGGEGPLYVPKCAVGAARRATQRVYYDADFANLAMGLAIENKGKTQTTANALTWFFETRGASAPNLLVRKSDAVRSVLEDVFFSREATEFLNLMVKNASQMGEWSVLAHDGTYKAVMSVLGKKPHGSAKDARCVRGTAVESGAEDFNVLHTIRGRTGAVPGIVPMRGESATECLMAIETVLPLSARETTVFLFSDSPDHFSPKSQVARGAVRRVLPNLLGVGEDPVHLPLRIESCSGAQRTELSRSLLNLHRKFFTGQSVDGRMYWGEDAGRGAAQWRESLVHEKAAKAKMREISRESPYLGKPFRDHAEYVESLMCIAKYFTRGMSRKNAKNQTALSILRAASTQRHFAFLQNGARYLGQIPAEYRTRLAVGTTSNEALHREIKNWASHVTQQRKERVLLVSRIFAIRKLACHTSAANHPTTMQLTQNQVACRIAGKIANGKHPVFRAFQGAPAVKVGAAQDLKTPRVEVHSEDTYIGAVRPWGEALEPQKKRPREEEPGRKCSRVKKRTVFTATRR